MYIIIQLIGENIHIENSFPTESESIEYIKHLTHLNIKGDTRTIQGVIHTNDEINMDGFYIEETDDVTIFNIVRRNTKLIPGWVVNGINQETQKIGTIQIKYVAHTQSNITNLNTNLKSIKKTIRNKPKQGGLFSAEVTAEFMKKIKEKQHNKKQKLD